MHFHPFKLRTIFLLSLIFFSVLLGCKKKNPSPQPPPVPNPNDTTGNGGGNNLPYGCLTVNLSGMQNTNGKVNFALFNSSSSFNNPNQAYDELFLNCTGSNMTFSLDSLPPGEYAFAIFHDENNNQQIDENFLGIPTEGFAFSNNAMGNFGPPSWSQSKFVIPDNNTVTQNITLNFF